KRLKKCHLCSFIYESKPEFIRHFKLQYPTLYVYCLVRRNGETQREHVVRSQPSRCCFCGYSEEYSDKMRHLALFHREKKGLIMNLKNYVIQDYFLRLG